MEKKEKKESKMQSKKNKQLLKQQQAVQNNKKQRKQPAQSSPDQESDQDIDLNQIQQAQGEEQQEEVSFLVAEINQKYYHSLKTILFRLSQITKTTNSQLADAVLQVKEVGNVVLADDEEDQDEDDSEEDDQQLEDDEENAYSVLTIVSGKNKLSKAIKKIVSKSAESKSLGSEVISTINSEATNLLINERLPNLPAFVVNSAHQVFKKDINQLKNSEEKKKYADLCSGYLLNVSEVQFEGSQELEKLVYSKFQDFQMCKRAKVWWLGERNSTYKKKADMRNLYYLIKTQEYFKGVDKIKTYLED